MIEIKFSPDAIDDLLQVKTYIEEELCSAAAAQHTIEKIISRIRMLSEFPQVGTPLSSVVGFDTDYRYLVCGNYLAFYRYEQNQAYIVRVLYERRDYIRILFRSDERDEGTPLD